MHKALAIETSCDETSVSLVSNIGDTFRIHSNIIASQIEDHSKWGGVVPELAARKHLELLPFVLDKALEEAKIKNPRVGTIDKFQGQEAPITIISMTSSDSDTLPRNKEFFFSRNRLNVAISRAQVSSIILFNPNLLDSSPRNLDQIKLMNNFFKILNFKI